MAAGWEAREEGWCFIGVGWRISGVHRGAPFISAFRGIKQYDSSSRLSASVHRGGPRGQYQQACNSFVSHDTGLWAPRANWSWTLVLNGLNPSSPPPSCLIRIPAPYLAAASAAAMEDTAAEEPEVSGAAEFESICLLLVVLSYNNLLLYGEEWNFFFTKTMEVVSKVV